MGRFGICQAKKTKEQNGHVRMMITGSERASTDNAVLVASNDNMRVRYRGGYPALKWLIKHDPDAALALFHHIRDDSSFQSDQTSTPIYFDPREYSTDDAEAHEIPGTPWESLDELIASGEGTDEMEVDRLHEVTPELHELLRSAGGVAWPWCGVRKKRDGKIKWEGEPWVYTFCCLPHTPQKHVTTLGGLTYYTKPKARRRHPGGMLVTFINDNGEMHRPNYKATKPRGGKMAYRTEARIDDYLAMPAAIASPMTAKGLRTPLSNHPAIMPMMHPLGRREPYSFMNWQTGIIDEEGRFGVVEARQILVDHGVDGSVAFDDLPFPATKCPTRRAKGARFIAGISAGKQTKSTAAIGKVPEPKVMTDTAAVVIEEVAARGNLTRIGGRLGYSGGYADRAGGTALLAAARELAAANDNNLKKLAA